MQGFIFISSSLSFLRQFTTRLLLLMFPLLEHSLVVVVLRVTHRVDCRLRLWQHLLKLSVFCVWLPCELALRHHHVLVELCQLHLHLVIIFIGRGGVGCWIKEISGLDNCGFWLEDFCLGSTHEFHLQ